MCDGTPIYDIKPYLEYTDSHKNIRNGFTDEQEWTMLKVSFSESAESLYSDEEKTLIKKILEQDPRPHYQNDAERIYGIRLEEIDVHFKVKDNDCIVL